MATRRIFWGFCINRFGIGPLHYISSRSDFGFEFAEIFVIEKQLPHSPSQGVYKIAYIYISFQTFKSVLRIHDILGVDPDLDPRIHASDQWIRIRILYPDPSIFVIHLQDASKKRIFSHNLLMTF
jgi:hypothetical protein